MVAVLLALLIGIVAGLRAMTAPAAVSWAAFFGWLPLDETWLAFLGYRFSPWILTLLAVGELIADQFPSIPSRKKLLPFATRILVGGVSGAAVGAAAGSLPVGLAAGAAGAVLGTLGGAAARSRLAAAFGTDRPAALLEDLMAIGGALLVVWLVS